MVGLVCHFSACMWIIIARINESESNWLLNFGFVDHTDGELWIIACYFSVTTITTVGFGDIYATNSLEKIMGIILKIFGVFMFSITSGTLT